MVQYSGRGEAGKGALDADMIVLSPGSSRLAYQWAAQLGHKLQAPVPSLFTFTIPDPLLQGLSGVSVQDGEVALFLPGGGGKSKNKFKERGPILVTHHGLSGPGVLRLSAFAARELHAAAYTTAIRVNWKPDIPRGVEGVLEELEALKKFQGSKAIGGQNGPTLDLPRRLWQAMVTRVGIAADLKWCDVKKADLRKLAVMVAQCDLQVSGKNTNKDEFVTAGGVSLNGVDMARMHSKSVPGPKAWPCACRVPSSAGRGPPGHASMLLSIYMPVPCAKWVR